MRRNLTFIVLLSVALAAAAQATGFTLRKQIRAGQFTPLCLPVNVTESDFEELYCIGGIDTNGRARIYPVSAVDAGTPFVARTETSRSTTNFTSTEVSTTQPPELPLTWEGGSVQGTYSNYTWNYTTELGNMGIASQLQFDPIDFMDVDIDVTLENLSVRRFFAQNRYSFASTSTSTVERYNRPPVERRDVPNPVVLPIPANATGNVSVTVGTADGLADVTQVETQAGETTCSIYNLIPQRTYYYQMTNGGNIVSKGKFHTKGHLRMIYAPSISNIRDLGGWPTQDGRHVRYGRIFRGGELNGQHVATEEDLQTLKNLGITSEIDLRLAARPEENHQQSALGFKEEDGNFIYIDGDDWAGSHLDTEATKEHLRKEFALIFKTLRNGGAVYFHCVWGADRTGLFALVLESVLGLTPDSYFKDYELTTFSIAGLRSKNTFADRPNYFNAFPGATLSERACYYLRTQLGISQEDIDFFLETMLE